MMVGVIITHRELLTSRLEVDQPRNKIEDPALGGKCEEMPILMRLNISNCLKDV